MRHEFRCKACGGRYWSHQLDGTQYEHVCSPLPAKGKHPERLRDGHRDENVVLDRRRRVTGIRSAGAGVVCLTNSMLEEPTWISALYKRIEQERGDDEA